MRKEEGDAFDLWATINSSDEDAIDIDVFAVEFFRCAFVVTGGIFAGV